MFPTLFNLKFGGREIAFHSYGVLIAIGLAVGIAFAYREGRRQGFEGGRVLDAAFWMIVAGLVGSRIAYGIVNAGDFARVCFNGTGLPRSAGGVLADCMRIFAIWQGGLVFFGGVAGAALVGWRFAKREGWSFPAFGDLAAPALALGHAFGRLGCFASGCCFGKVSSGSWAVSFPRGSVAFEELASQGAVPPGWQTTPPLHATQLYEAFGELAIFAALLVLRPRVRSRPGTLLITYLGLYALLRFVVEMFRGDVIRGLVVGLSTPRLAGWLHLPPNEPVFLSVGQLVSLLVLALCGVAWTKLWPPRARASAARTRSREPRPRGPNQAQKDQQHQRADEGDEDRTGDTTKRSADVQLAEDEPTKESAYYPHDYVADDAITATHDGGRKPPRDESDHDPD